MPSAELERAVENAVASRTVNNGQSCIAAKRFIIHQDVYQEFQARFVDAMESLSVGDPTKDSTQIGPLATPKLLSELEQQVAAAKQAGAAILCGGERMLGIGNFYEPTVLAGVPRNCAVYRDEIFGPVAMLFPAQSLSHAIEIANDTPFGLGASVWTKDPNEQQQLIASLECGQVFVNAIVASDPRLPFGGIKRSGYGRELSAAGMREFLNAKTVVVAEDIRPTEVPAEPAAVRHPVRTLDPTPATVPNKPSEATLFRDALRSALAEDDEEEEATDPHIQTSDAGRISGARKTSASIYNLDE
jgi:succinate-semialdehyde dehydrogenase/glutarate-semialdehyde dehydrogenase